MRINLNFFATILVVGLTSCDSGPVDPRPRGSGAVDPQPQLDRKKVGATPQIYELAGITVWGRWRPCEYPYSNCYDGLPEVGWYGYGIGSNDEATANSSYGQRPKSAAEIPDTVPVAAPICPVSDTAEPWERDYCSGVVPGRTSVTRKSFLAAMNRLELRGGICAQLAAFGRNLLEQGKVRYFNAYDDDLRSFGGPGVGIIIQKQFIHNAEPYNHEWVLAHELEHAMTGYVHDLTDVDAAGVKHTPNDTYCGN